LESLADAPEMGERREDIAQDIRAFVVRPYVIFYYASVDGIHVARIIHGARDFSAMFR
jgi:toxin ParE1/3/4